MTNSEIFKAAHKIAGTLRIEGSYAVRLNFGLVLAHKLNKLGSKIESNAHITFWSNFEVKISDSLNAISNNKMKAKGLTLIDSMFSDSIIYYKETESQKFTRLAVVKFNNAA